MLFRCQSPLTPIAQSWLCSERERHGSAAHLSLPSDHRYGMHSHQWVYGRLGWNKDRSLANTSRVSGRTLRYRLYILIQANTVTINTWGKNKQKKWDASSTHQQRFTLGKAYVVAHPKWLSWAKKSQLFFLVQSEEGMSQRLLSC